ncbi:BREX-1 system adenine-specific DNA-methyltransferase PglX [Thermithiobacillus plumbiphilus]|uniref:site-specific DNA-methyltransferase (adenine-specific) n=1 Tax=Thermithiobacillus plumbiphilus TaxID=1729899 RepID=A0ABU9D6P5_9PROT
MAFDQTTRKRLSDFVNEARRTLEEEFTRQLQNDYGLDPVLGAVTAIDSLRHLNDAQRETARILRDTLAHYCAAEHVETQAGLDRIVREQAFTVLNRLAALRMAEARGLLIESVGNGYQAKGFQLYARLAGTGLGETGDAYRVYLFSVFDELAQDLPSLFDRYSPQGRLFPREAALLGVLALINDPEIEPLWAEDETIGWIYQYFNSKEERKAMRDASQAPRNSRELAVRNQFFTPRYVVEFLVDNTLGRLWFNATSGQTALRERCQYLLVKPDEQRQATARLRDPRTLKLLDPACGSMHFGLYAFDLFLEIYREAWAWEQQHGPGSLDVSTQPETDLKPLCQTYLDEAAFLRDVPRLIIENNIYGVDIDPRAAQIATLALWLRAQRAWHEARIPAKDRPAIGRGHVLAAVAPPAERELHQQIAAVLDHLDAELFDKTLQLLKGLPELGVLLQVERELPHLIREVYGEHGPMFKEADMEQWRKAEGRLRKALTEFAQAAKSTYQGRLFVQDALHGLRLVDLARETFDVVVMNPPFGEAAERARDYQKQTYPNSHQDIFQCFVERALEITRTSGMVGVLSARTGFFMGDSESWRTEVVWKNQLLLFADLGLGVLDDALVEAAAYVIQHGVGEDHRIVASRHLATRDKETSLLKANQEIQKPVADRRDVFVIPQDVIQRIPGNVFAYWAPVVFLDRFQVAESFQENVATVRQGLATADDFRFVRLAWEVPPAAIGTEQRWRRFSKGGEYSPPYDDIHLLVDWGVDGEQIKASVCQKYPYLNGNWSFVVKNSDLYFQAGATYTVRTASAFAAKVLPAGCIFSHNAQSWFIDDRKLLQRSIVYFLSRVSQAYLELAVGGGDIATSGSAARRYTTKVVNSIPASVISNLAYDGFDEDCDSLFRLVAYDQSLDETTCFFAGYSLSNVKNLSEAAHRITAVRQRLVTEALRASFRIDTAVTQAWNLSQAEIEYVRAEVGPHLCEYGDEASVDDVSSLWTLPVDQLIRRGVEQDGASRWLTKKSYFVDRKTELICHLLRCSPESVERAVSTLAIDKRQMAERVVSYAVGMAFGRWTEDEVDRGPLDHFVSNPFDELPRVPPAAQRSKSGKSILVSDTGHSRAIIAAVQNALASMWPSNAGGIEGEILEALGCDLDQYFERGFFPAHIAQYGKSRRTAPIYWPLSTASGSYVLWIYYAALSSQTLYTAINDFVEPKLKQVSEATVQLRNKGAGRSRAEEKQFEELQAFELELIELRDTLLKLAPTYKPNHDDGVQISAAPLWPLFRHKPWQKVLKDTWEKLKKGEYDWAHLAMNYWPERVREKCKTDKSLAIAHGLEEIYEEPEAKPKKTRGRKKGG